LPIPVYGFTVSRFPVLEKNMEREYTLPEAAESVGASVDQLRYWITLMEIESTRRGKCRYLAEEDVSRLRGMAAMVKSGTPPKEAAALARERPTEAVIIPAPAAEPPAISNDFQRVLLLLAEENKQIKQTMGAILEEVRAVRMENSTLREQMNLLTAPKQDEKLLEVLNRTPEPVKVWQPEPKTDPLEGLAWYQRAWVEAFEPWRMRKYAS